MKKFLLSVAALISACMLNALTVDTNVITSIDNDGITPSTIGDNWFVELNTGVGSTLNKWRGSYKIEASVGKWFTPFVGLSLSDAVYINYPKTSNTIDRNILFADVRLNLFNINKYRNREFNLQFIPSIGWCHIPEYKEARMHRNDAVGKVALQSEFRLNDAWHVFVKPEIMYTRKFRNYTGEAGISIGATYNFKGIHSHSRVFEPFPYMYTSDEYHELLKKYKSLKDNPTVVTKIQEVVKEVTKVGEEGVLVVPFSLGSSELTDIAREILDKIPAGSAVTIEGYASPDGNASFNYELSYQRGITVSQYLSYSGIRTISVVGMGFEDADLNSRIVLVRYGKDK